MTPDKNNEVIAEIRQQIEGGKVPGEALYSAFLSREYPSMSELSRQLGVSVAAISRMVNGRNNISVEMAVRIESLTGLSAEDLMGVQNMYELMKARQSFNAPV